MNCESDNVELPKSKLFKNLLNIKFGRWLVVSYAGVRVKPSGQRYNIWNCICDCGERSQVSTSNLTRGLSKSCGCYSVDLLINRSVTHGNCRHPMYMRYIAMIDRCYNAKNLHYKHYGNRGITVCDRWLESFDNYLEDMGCAPSGLTLDRVNNDGNYEPANCRWATRSEQNLNKRPSTPNTSGHNGVGWNKRAGKWQVRIRIDGEEKYLGIYADIAEAVDVRREAELYYTKTAYDKDKTENQLEALQISLESINSLGL